MMKWPLSLLFVALAGVAGCSPHPTLPSSAGATPAFIRDRREGRQQADDSQGADRGVRPGRRSSAEFAPPPASPTSSSACSKFRRSSGAPTRSRIWGVTALTASTSARRPTVSYSSRRDLTTSRWAPSHRSGAADRRPVLWFDGAPASALFHADCGGRTSRADDVWGGTGRGPTSLSVADDGPAECGAFDMDGTSDARRGAARAERQDARTRAGARLDGLCRCSSATARDEPSGSRSTAPEERVVRGEELREVLADRRSAHEPIRSTRFDVAPAGQSSSSRVAASATASGCARPARSRAFARARS